MSRVQTKHVAVIHGDLEKPFPFYPNRNWVSNDNQIISRLHEALGEIPGYRFTYFSHHDTLWADLERARPTLDMVLQLCDDGYMNDSDKALHICAMLDLIGIPYTGSGVRAMAVTADKQAQLTLARSMGVPVPESRYVELGAALPEDVKFPAFVKPNGTDGSFGITRKSLVRNPSELKDAVAVVREEFALKCPILIQEFIDGPDVTVSILGNPPDALVALPPTIEDYSALPDDLPKIFGYEAKWDQSSPYWKIQTKRAELPEATAALLMAASQALFSRFGIQDYGRFDWRLDEHGEPHFLEANANCGWCWDGHLALAASFGGLSYSQLFEAILRHAFRRHGAT
jgi:D-alanine-D-alanine ligase